MVKAARSIKENITVAIKTSIKVSPLRDFNL